MVRPSTILLALAVATAQTPAPQTPDTVIRINVNLVQVDAAVTDSKGKPVTDLQAADFEILQDGKPQVITNFSYITTGRGAAPPPAIAAGRGAPPVPPARLRTADIKRTVALVVDDLGLSFESMAYTRQALKKFVDQQMQQGDLVAIIRTGAGIGALQQFTSDKRVLYAAIDRIKYNALGRVGVSSFAPLGGGSGDAGDSMTTERNEIFSVGTLGAIRYVMQGLQELPGRKTVMLFSENLKLFNRGTASDRVLEAVRHLTDEANRASAVIYTIDPRGLQVHGLTAADSTGDMTPQQIAEVPMQRATEEFDSREGLVVLAHDTGGRFFADTNDIYGAVREALQDADGYYLIGYHPNAETFDKTGQPKFHRVSVRLKRPGLHVRSRSGFYGAPDRQSAPVPHTRESQISRALTSPFGANAINVRLTPLYTVGPKGAYLNTLLYIDGKDLTFTDEPDGWHKAVIDIVAMTFGDNGQAVDASDRTYTLRARNESYDQALKGLLYKVSHPVRKPGAYQMRVVVRDAGSEHAGSASQFIEAPDVGKGRLTLSSMMIREQTPAAAAATPEHPEGQVAVANIQGSEAVRLFKQGQSVLYGYEVLNAHLDTNKQPQLEAQTRIFREGKQVYEGKPMPLSFMGQVDPKLLVAGGTLKLGAQITPGDYVIQVTVTDKLAKEKYRTASQWIDFEIQ